MTSLLLLADCCDNMSSKKPKNNPSALVGNLTNSSIIQQNYQRDHQKVSATNLGAADALFLSQMRAIREANSRKIFERKTATTISGGMMMAPATKMTNIEIQPLNIYPKLSEHTISLLLARKYASSYSSNVTSHLIKDHHFSQLKRPSLAQQQQAGEERACKRQKIHNVIPSPNGNRTPTAASSPISDYIKRVRPQCTNTPAQKKSSTTTLEATFGASFPLPHKHSRRQNDNNFSLSLTELKKNWNGIQTKEMQKELFLRQFHNLR